MSVVGTNVLQQILTRKREELAQRKAQVPLMEMLDRAEAMPPARDFRAALQVPPAVIAELKRRSPSHGEFKPHLDILAQARAYERGGAAAVSVLTDGAFGMEPEALTQVHDAVSLPVLRKDFILDAYGVYESRALGADALLLIVAALDRSELAELYSLARGLGMAALVEVHDAAELEAALACGAEIIGINSRNLRTFATDLTVIERLAARIPQGITIVAESGISEAEQIAALLKHGVGAFLVGESLLTAVDPAEKLRELVGTGPCPVRGRGMAASLQIKFCGITNLEDARACLDAGATHLGFVFANSPRRVDAEQVRAMLGELPTPRSFVAVGVFKDMGAEEIVELVNGCGLDAVQLHGIDDPTEIELIHQRTGKPVILAVAPGANWAQGLQLAGNRAVDMLLLDARGEYFDWRLTHEARALGKPVLLAGGLTPGTVGLAVTVARPDGVDVASGVESVPGKKDEGAVREFAEAARAGWTGRRACHVPDASDHPGQAEPPVPPLELAPNGRFGAYRQPYGGAYVPETLVPALEALTQAYSEARADGQFGAQLADLLTNYAGRPTPLFHAARLSAQWGRSSVRPDDRGSEDPRHYAQVWLKREDLLHTGAHKLNNCLGQALLAQRMGKRRVIAETGAGQHGVGTATVCALLGLDCVVYMGAEDMRRQAPNVRRMRLLGAEVRPVSSGSATLKDATSEAIRDWVGDPASYYLIGSTVGPHPYPTMVRDFQREIGEEARAQVFVQAGRLPDVVVACVGGGSNALGAFYAFLYDADVELHGVEAAGEGLDGQHAATLSRGRPGVLHGTLSYLLQDAAGQVAPVHSISAGLDYPGCGPEHSFLKDVGRADYFSVTDAEALAAFHELARYEGILPALESSHALAHAKRLAAQRPGALLLVNLSGRGDKDLDIVSAADAEAVGGAG